MDVTFAWRYNICLMDLNNKNIQPTSQATKSSGRYELLDCGDFRKYERIAGRLLIRPSPQAVWPVIGNAWTNSDATFERYTGGDGKWLIHNKKIQTGSPSSPWIVDFSGLLLELKLTDFGHLGLFPEQAPHWEWLTRRCAAASRSAKEPFKVLNLFAYTGGSTLACARGGADVTHVDASKTSVAWARDNAALNSMAEKPIRWIIDDVQKYIAREIKRGARYHGFILDPPSFGRGTKNETWKIEEHLGGLLKNLTELAADNFSFVMLSAHSNGYTPIALANLVRATFGARFDKLEFDAHEMLVPTVRAEISLPSGAACIAYTKNKP